jgi:NAD(P)-dependent dehydrogenase (short-subunit alcohol dehydrogenase family)
MVMRLAGKIATISGAASGKGTATALMFAREGAKVVVPTCWSTKAGRLPMRSAPRRGFEPLDVTKEERWAAVVAATTGISASSMCWSTMPASPDAAQQTSEPFYEPDGRPAN